MSYQNRFIHSSTSVLDGLMAYRWRYNSWRWVSGHATLACHVSPHVPPTYHPTCYPTYHPTYQPAGAGYTGALDMHPDRLPQEQRL